jgi:hypothetical protein
LRRTLLVVLEQPVLVSDRVEQVGHHLRRRLAVGARLQAVDEFAEFEQRRQLARLHTLREALFEGRREQRQLALAGIAAERLQRAGADATPGRADGADEGRVVVTVGEQAQVGGDVLDLGLLEEGLAARQQVGDALVAQKLFERARLEVAAVEDRIVAESAAMFEAVSLQLHDHRLGLLFVVLADADGDRVAVAEVGPQLLVEQLLVVRDQALAALRMRTVER